MTPIDRETEGRARALEAWAVVRTMIRPGTKLRRPRLVDGPWPGAGRAAVWPLSQVLAAAVDLVRAGWIEGAEVHELLTILDTYRDGDGFGPVSYTHLTLPTIYSV